MAKAKQPKQPKQPKQAPVTSAIQVAYDALLPVFRTYAQEVEDSGKKTVNRSASIVKTIDGLWVAFAGDVSGYLAAIVELFGNGKKTKADRVAGKFADALHAEKITAGAVYGQLSYARDVGFGYTSEEIRKLAAESGLRAAQRKVKPPKKAEAETAPTAPTQTVEQMTRHAFIDYAMGHLDDLLLACRNVFVHQKDAIALGKLGEIEVHLASPSKTAKTG